MVHAPLLKVTLGMIPNSSGTVIWMIPFSGMLLSGVKISGKTESELEVCGLMTIIV